MADPETNAPKGQQSDGILDIGLAVFLLTILSLLVTNVYIMQLAKSFNDKACYDATREAALAGLNGKDVNGMMRAAQDGLNRSGQGGFFIQAPMFTEFWDGRENGVRKLKVETQTQAKVLAPILLFDSDAQQKGSLVFKSVCVVEFKKH
jgi:hypothetical protein